VARPTTTRPAPRKRGNPSNLKTPPWSDSSARLGGVLPQLGDVILTDAILFEEDGLEPLALLVKKAAFPRRTHQKESLLGCR
jgi:hypothetical protein